jgi:hypothetical protein
MCKRILINVTHNLSKQRQANFKDLEPLRGSSNKKTLYSTRSCVNWALYGTRGPFLTKIIF